ncbi:MAG: class I SAM-dependent methyltransferase [Candidatus Omnitrophica bacterium]|nr:class I SAM-dependent methyltransferase [Candidatus Omnitrophota bacterium]
MVHSKVHRSLSGRFFDTLLFPLRALFAGTEPKWGLSTLRDERMRAVARHCKGRVLDVGCGPGNLFIRDFIGPDQGVGVDVFAYEGVENVVDDPCRLPFEDESFDTLSLVAVVSHIPQSKRVEEFKEFARVLKPGGLLVATEGEPVTQTLVHQWAHFYCALRGKKDMDTERGMEEDEQYCMPHKELLSYLNTPPLQFVRRRPFMWGLNWVFIAQKQGSF